jgi:hypothetical protein
MQGYAVLQPKDIPFYSMGFSRKRQSIRVGLAKVCAALAHNMQFYYYRIDRKIMGTKWSRALALLFCKEERELLEGLVLEVLEERLRHNVTYREVNISNQSIKCDKHMLYECIERKRKWFKEFWHKNHWIWSCGWKDMNFWSFEAIFVDFSEARALFVNIFRILDLTAKILDRGLISENLRVLSAKSAKSGPRVDFTKVQGPLCNISEIIWITNYFPMVNPVHRVHARWTGAGRVVHCGPTVARTEGTAARSPEPGLRPLQCAKARQRGHKMERGARGTRLGSHWSSSSTVEAERRWCRMGKRRRSVRGLLRRGEREIGAVRVLAFYRGPGERRGGLAERLTLALMALMPFKRGRLDERLRSVIKEGNQGVG